MNDQYKVTGIVLAAGEATRMGKAKQMLPVDGRPMLETVIRNLQAAGVEQVYVVTGAYREETEALARSCGAVVLYNDEWQEGMASSIRCAIGHLESIEAAAEAVVIALADQPFIPAGHFEALKREQSGNPESIIASSYDQTIGVPACFPKVFWPALLMLRGDRGAQKTIESSDYVVTVPLPAAESRDINTPGDLA